MIDDYALQERIAIKIDSHIPEHLAIKQAKQEMETPECVDRLNKLHERKKMDDAEKHAKHSRRFNYD